MIGGFGCSVLLFGALLGFVGLLLDIWTRMVIRYLGKNVKGYLGKIGYRKFGLEWL